MKNIVQEILSLEKFAIQKIWHTSNNCFVLEIFHKIYKKLYLIISLNEDFFILIQKDKPSWIKKYNNFLLLIKKYYINSVVNIFLNNHNYDQIILSNNYSQLLISNKPKNISLFTQKQDYHYYSNYNKIVNQTYINHANNNFINNTKLADNINKKYLNYQKEQSQAELVKKQKKQLKLLANLQNDLQKWQNNLLLEQTADLLKNNLHNIRTKEKSINCIDYFSAEQTIKTITIPVNLNANEYIAKLYNTVKKAKRAIVHIKNRIELEEKNLSNINISDLSITAHEEKKLGKRLPFRKFISSDNIAILIAKSAKDSDDMLRKYADGNDFWFHARDATSAHCIVKYKAYDLPINTLLEAAMLVFHFSKKTTKNIQYTKMKWVKKVKGAKSGSVTVSQEKTIFINIEQEKLNSLLKQHDLAKDD